MEPRPATPPRWLPARRPLVPPSAGPEPAAPPPPAQAPPPPEQRFSWRRLTRSRRGAAGLTVGAAALLLWPFSEWSWLPWLAALGVLVLLRLLRLDGLLRGWVLHLGGLVVVAGLMLSTGPWAWALAASIGVLLAGLAQLPWWRLAAVGAVLCLLSGVGFGFSVLRSSEVQRVLEQRQSDQSFSLLGERTPKRVLPALLEGIGQGDTVAVCGLLDDRAREQFVQAAAQAPDCGAAVTAFRGILGNKPQLRDLAVQTTQVGALWESNGCRTQWGTTGLGGPALGVLEIRQSEPPGRTFFIAAFRPC